MPSGRSPYKYFLGRMVDRGTDGSNVMCRFSYSHINEALNFLSYTPDISYKWVCENKKMKDCITEKVKRTKSKGKEPQINAD